MEEFMSDANRISVRTTIAATISSAKEPPSLDETIAIALRLLPELRALDAAQLRTLAANLRILSNVAEAWAYRNEKSSQTDDE
jgi:hypothetical protein